ncbi:MAG: elongation factor G [Candidatus Margulisbacteria bacterium]|nr:elongation factor G [Candidatus Margulisiibacteriota bacterium]MBU1022071.1 elongation factor G [Candidatus Margulisiibacteriota bacterium]MBU1729666.1 elongation factor G [Candidatus Margulisiibacteriota bacterium]MBU1954986.1 elongation factor G [Candidatus Margulisiibacteriota bacterium]
MKQYSPENIRNVVVVGHASAGKTSLVEALLFCAGSIPRLGSVDNGNSTTDYHPQEIKRKMSIQSSLAPLEFHEHKINLIDTPGYLDFIGEAISGMSVADGVLFVFDGLKGAGVGAERIWKLAEEKHLPRIGFINKLDKERSSFNEAVKNIRKKFGTHLAPVQIPIGSEANFRGVYDLITGKAYEFDGGKKKEIPVPDEIKDMIPLYKEMLIETTAEVDDSLLEDYMDNQEITEEKLRAALGHSIKEGSFFPLLCGSAIKNIGIELIEEEIDEYLPPASEKIVKAKGQNDQELEVIAKDEEPFSAHVYKSVIEAHVGELTYIRIYSGTLAPGANVFNTTKRSSERAGQLVSMCGKNKVEIGKAHAGDIVVIPKLKNTKAGDSLCTSTREVAFESPVYPEAVCSLAVKPKSKADQEKMSLGLHVFASEDPTFKVSHNIETKETVISGIGDLQLEAIIENLKEKYKVEIEKGAPKIPYKETIRKKTQAQGKYKKQSGGRGQYGDTWIKLEPLPRGQGFEFTDTIVGGAIPKNYIPSVEKGVRETLITGVISGYPVVDIKVTLYDGTFHEVDSSDLAFKIAASMGFKKAFADAKPVILEPIVHIEVYAPQEYIGDVTGDLNRKRARIQSIEIDKVAATVPLAEVANYSTQLRSMTHGQGSFSMHFSHYEEVLPKTQEMLVATYDKAKAEGGLQR